MANNSAVFRTAGRLHSIRETVTAELNAAVGELCEIHLEDGKTVSAEVIGTEQGIAQLMVFDSTSGLAPGMEVISTGRRVSVPVGDALIGRILNGLGQPIDGQGPLRTLRRSLSRDIAPHALKRERVNRPLETGIRAIDGLLTIGQGQRMGLFAGSGVGKSTLLGEIARNSSAELNVIALVGERGREVLPFIEDCLGDVGLKRSVVVVATSDETSLMKRQAVQTAISIAEEFRIRGTHVMFFLDSLTRFAQAQRAIGLARGETPGLRGFPASVQTSMAAMLERLGNDDRGSITSLITILVDADDLDEPISDAARSILDGHLVLTRSLAAKGHYPAIDVLQSISRVFDDVTTLEHNQAAQAMREVMATYAEVADLIQVGLYQQGTSSKIDRCLQLMPTVNRFLKQDRGTSSSFKETLQQMKEATSPPSQVHQTTI